MEMNNKDDIEKLNELMKTLNDTLPDLISGIIEGVYSKEDEQKLANSTTKFYKELVNTGMEEKIAYGLTREYLNRRDIGHLIREVLI